ncbi:hypothetical protein Tco_0752700 [Tanacetum coccineum]|uniref:Retrovirus-related Pol polyprotein from transposon TNT 1-94-like beta-barrel domain-containing protein n=1 Tax=Tanacetum coccineum TaxID=301880 RepID=A0ABQ4Z7L7_9ASTR
MYKEYLAKFWYSATTLENFKVSFSIPLVLGSGFPLLTIGKKFPPKELSGRASFLLGVTSEARANPQLSSGMSAFYLNKPIYSASFIIHSEYASANDASAVSTAKADPGNSAPSTDLHVFADKTKSVSDGLETVLTIPKTRTSNAAKTSEEIKFGAIKLEDLAKLVPNVKVDFKDMDSPEDDLIIVVYDNKEDKEEDNNEEIHFTTNDETKHILASTPPSPSSIQLQELKNQILSAHDFSSSLPTKLKDLPSKFNELTKEVKGINQQVHELELELPRYLKDIPSKLEDFTKTITSLTSQVAKLKTLQWELPAEFLSLPVQFASVQAKLKTVDALPDLLLNVTKYLNKFAQVFDSASSKARDQGVPSAGQADTMPAEGEKNTNQATISQLFQRRAKKNAERKNLNKPQPETTPPPIPPIITTTTHMQSPFLSNPPKSFSQLVGEQTKIDKGKKAMSSKDTEEESTKSDSDDETTHVPSSTIESSKKKRLKRFDFVTKDGEHVHLTKEQISAQKKIEEEAKDEAARREGEIKKEELIDLFGPEVVNRYYNNKLQYDIYCDKMLNRRAISRITNYEILTRKGPITLKIHREEDTSEIIPEFKASDLHLGEWREVVTACPNKKANKRLKSSVQYKDHPVGNVLNEPVLGKSQSEHIDEFHKLVGDLAAIITVISDEDQALLLLTSLPSSYDNFMTEAQGDGGEGLYVRGRSGQRDIEHGTNSVWSKSQEEAADSADEYDSVDVMMAMSVEELLDWIIDSGGSYHITYRRDYFVDFKEFDGGNIMLGDGRECCISRTGKVQVQMRDGLSFMLDNVSDQEGIKGYEAVRRTSDWVEDQDRYCKDTQQNGLVKETNATLLAKVYCFLIQSGLSKDFFGWLASIKQGMLEPVKVKCIFLGYCKGIVGTGSVQVLQGVEFEVEPQEDHTFKVEPYGNVDHVVGSQEVPTQDLIYYHSACNRKQHSTWELFSYREDSNEAAFAVAVVDKIYAHESLTFNNTVTCEVISKWKAGLKDDMDARSDVYVFSNGCRKCSDDSDGYYLEYTPSMFIHLFLYIDDMVFPCGCKAKIWATKGLLDKAKGNVLGMEISIRDCDVEKDDAGMLDKFDRGLLTNVQVFMDFDYTMGRSITIMGRSITRYMTLTKAAKEAIWLKGLAIESGFELKIVVGIYTGALSKAILGLRFQHRLNLLSIELDSDWYQMHLYEMHNLLNPQQRRHMAQESIRQARIQELELILCEKNTELQKTTKSLTFWK